MVNTNCLKDIRCPECGYEDNFKITATSTFDMFDDGSDSHGDVEFGESAPCECGECQFAATVKEFSV